ATHVACSGEQPMWQRCHGFEGEGMNIMKRRALPVIVSAVLGVSAAAHAAEPSMQEMQSQIEQLQAELNKMKSQQEQQLNAADVDATVEAVLRDADRRSQLLQTEGFTAGYNKGKFLIQSADGNFSLNPNIHFQVRHVTNYAENVDGGDDDTEHGFEIRRMKFGVGGNAFSKNLKYTFVWGSGRNGGDLSLQDAL